MGVRSVVCGGLGCRFPSPMDFAWRRGGIPGALTGHVKSGALGAWRLNICKIMDKKFRFDTTVYILFCLGLDLLLYI